MIINKGVTIGSGIQVGESAQEYPTYSMTVSKTTITENNDVLECTVTTTGVLDGTVLLWSTAGTVQSSQLKVANGYVTVKNSVAIVSIVTNANNASNGPTTFTVSIRTDSVNSPVVAISPPISVIDSSNPVVGQAEFNTAGTYTWVAPAGVYNVSVLAVGAGGGGGKKALGLGGGGGALVWVNSIPVSPGTAYPIKVGARGGANQNGNGSSGGDSWFLNSTYIKAGGGGGGLGGDNNTVLAATEGGTYLNNTGFAGGGGNGGGANGTTGTASWSGGGGGGAGGYNGNGGTGSMPTYGTGLLGNATGAAAGSGGAGGGSAGPNNLGRAGGAGGGVGILGIGNTGTSVNNNTGSGGGGGSGGDPGYAYNTVIGSPMGGVYGGGGGGGTTNNTGVGYDAGAGQAGAVRIIWGTGRAFPSSLTTDQTPI